MSMGNTPSANERARMHAHKQIVRNHTAGEYDITSMPFTNKSTDDMTNEKIVRLQELHANITRNKTTLPPFC